MVMENLMAAAAQPNEGQPPVADPVISPADPAAKEPPAGDPAAVVKPPEDVKPPEGAPETYAFKAPEGQEFDPKFLEAYAGVAKELNLTQDSAQKLIDTINPVLAQRQAEQVEAVQTEWLNSSKTDKEFGGEKLNESLGIAKAALAEFGTPQLKDLLDKSGLSNHPEVIRLLYKAGKALAQDTFVGGQQLGKGAPKNFNEQADRLYDK